MGVDLGRRDVHVAQEVFQRVQRRAAAQMVESKRMAQAVRCDLTANARLACAVLHDQPEALPRETSTPVIEEERFTLLTLAACEIRPAIREVRAQGVTRRLGDRD